MGDCLWGTPGIRALKKTFPDIKIDLLVNWPWRSLFDFNPYLNQIFDYYGDWYRQPLLGIKLLRRNYDAVLIFHTNSNFKRMLPWFHSLTIWCHQNFSWVPKAHRVNIHIEAHGIQRKLLMLEKFGVKPDGGQMEIFFDQNILGESQQFLNARGFSPEKFVFLNLGASVEIKRWEIGRFKELAERILKKTPWKIVLGGGGADDQQRNGAILNQLDSARVLDVCNQPILLNAAIISKARLMVSADTGPMHIGLAVKTPVVALSGIISHRSGPYEVPDHLCRVIKIDPEEKDEFDKPYSEGPWLRGITVDQVWEQVEKMLV